MNNFFNQIELVGYINNVKVSKNTPKELINQKENKTTLIKFHLKDNDLKTIFNEESLLLGDIFFNKRNKKFYIFHLSNMIENKGIFYGFSLYPLDNIGEVDYELHSQKYDNKNELEFIYKNELKLIQLSKKLDNLEYTGNIYIQYKYTLNRIVSLGLLDNLYPLESNLFMIQDVTYKEILRLIILIRKNNEDYNYTISRINFNNGSIFKKLLIDKEDIEYALFSYLQSFYLMLGDFIIEKDNSSKQFFFGLNNKGSIDFFNESETTGYLLKKKRISYDNIYDIVGYISDYNHISSFSTKEVDKIKYKEYLLHYISNIS